MAADDDIEAIDAQLLGPEEVQASDGKRVKQRPLKDLLDLRRAKNAEVGLRRPSRVSYVRIRDEGC